MRVIRARLDACKSAGELENELIDDFNDGHVTRRELLRRGSVLGMSIPCSASSPACRSRRQPQRVQRTGGTLRVGSSATDGSLEPPLLQSLGAGRLAHRGRAARRQELRLVPRIATSWKASNRPRLGRSRSAGTSGSDGTPLTADDVVATFKRLLPAVLERQCDPVRSIPARSRRRRSITDKPSRTGAEEWSFRS